MAPFYKGESITLKATFKDDDGALTDPSTPVKVYAKSPSGDSFIDGETATKISTGVFTFTHAFSVVGKVHYSFQSADGAIEVKKINIAEDTSK